MFLRSGGKKDTEKASAPAPQAAQAAVVASERARPATEADARTAPDPFTAVLPALAALGAIASIASINWVAQERTPERMRPKRKAATALRDLESCCLGLQEIFRRFQRAPRLFAGQGASVASPMKFGVHGTRIDQTTAKFYQQLVNDIASMLVLASQNSFDVMCAVEDGEIDAPEELFFGFGEEQERLNTLLQGRATLKTSVEQGLGIATRLTQLVGQLKSCRVE
jgi:hypothetical protein